MFFVFKTATTTAFKVMPAFTETTNNSVQFFLVASLHRSPMDHA